ncbi:hypothetical protein RhiirA5_442143 [Rhizophagus irregularis]|uniref:Uncharacterized protein n=1 Tax=Rhizophagus irregularis TaxID=588596 RepID=A0A2N0NF11_9GLOM|nr:hypothetical protein RhiirA5_442143 [Rhizophagus irregularis]
MPNVKYKNIYNHFKLAQHRGNRQQSKKKSFADTVKGKNQSRPENNNGNNRTPNPNLQNSTTSGGSMHDNQLVNSQLHQVRQMMTELQSMFKVSQTPISVANSTSSAKHTHTDVKSSGSGSDNDDIIKQQSEINSSMSLMSSKLDKFINYMGFGSSPDLIDGDDDDEEQEMDYDPSTHDNEAGDEF